MVYTGIFSGIQHARNFASKHATARGYGSGYGSGGGGGGGYNSSEKTSATWTPSGTGKRAKVTIDKTDAAYKHILAVYEEHQKELRGLGPLLGGGSSGSGDGGEGTAVQNELRPMMK